MENSALLNPALEKRIVSGIMNIQLPMLALNLLFYSFHFFVLFVGDLELMN